MKAKTAINFVAAYVLLTWAGAAFSQHSPVRQGSGHDPASGASPYAGQQTRDIKSLSAAQTEDLLAGKGMELAKAAELNGYPGPMHTLELAQALARSPAQKQATQELLGRHKADARRLGAMLVEAERSLDQSFLTRQIDTPTLQRHTERIAGLQAELRASHLQTHLQQTALLSPQQINRYIELRGYTAGSAAEVKPSSHKH